MAIDDRRRRERAARRRLIITTARTLAEAEGWDAVTTRRLSTQIEYSQPVLYKHFRGMGQIADAVASTVSVSSPSGRADGHTWPELVGSPLVHCRGEHGTRASQHPESAEVEFGSGMQIGVTGPHPACARLGYH